MIQEFEQFLNEGNVTNRVISFLKSQMLKDKNEYRGHIPTKYNKGVEWDDSSWFVSEILAFLNNDYTISYTLLEFFSAPIIFKKGKLDFDKSYDYDIINEILKDNFKSEYQKALSMMK